MADVDRGVSTVLGYTLNIVVATLLVTGLLVAAGSLVDSQRQQATRSELTVVGERLVANLETTDRLSRAAGDGHVSVHATLPDQVAGANYEITISDAGGQTTAVLTTTDPSVRVSLPIRNETAVATGTTAGGSVDIVWSSGNPIEVRHG